ncbi:alkene reductase [Paraburkholderia tropica]|uniref:alkene reductase n=1 Tax=Paraburkholderia tropica TaxID=92647 RepID=UPI002AB5EE58|nr:alkene reductase [Paraburkholderia tropica]
MTTLIDPIRIGDLELPNRIAMAPLTRARAGDGDVPTELNATYYAQRAGNGLIVTEATDVAPNSRAFEHAPGIWSDAQVTGWKRVVDGVHANGGRIFLQLWHGGRVGAAGTLGGEMPVSPSGYNDDLTKLSVWGLLANGRYVQIAATPSRAMTTDEVKGTIDAYRRAAENASRAGFDGVEIHAANGYLPHQFLSPVVNTREDQYGGSIANRARFLSEIVEAVAQVLPSSRIGVRLSPFTTYNNPQESESEALYSHVVTMLNEHGIGYVHIADMNGWFGQPDLPRILDIVRPRFDGAIIANGGISIEQGNHLLRDGVVQMISFGRLALANPDLATRIKFSLPLADARPTGWYAGGESGYTDYPSANAS